MEMFSFLALFLLILRTLNIEPCKLIGYAVSLGKSENIFLKGVTWILFLRKKTKNLEDISVITPVIHIWRLRAMTNMAADFLCSLKRCLMFSCDWVVVSCPWFVWSSQPHILARTVNPVNLDALESFDSSLWMDSMDSKSVLVFFNKPRKFHLEILNPNSTRVFRKKRTFYQSTSENKSVCEVLI